MNRWSIANYPDSYWQNFFHGGSASLDSSVLSVLIWTRLQIYIITVKQWLWLSWEGALGSWALAPLTGGRTRSRFAASLRGFYGRGALRGCLTITSSFFTSWHNNSQGEQRSFQKNSSLFHELSHRFVVPNKILFPSALQTPLTQPTPWLGDAWQSKIKIYHHHIIVIITSLNHHHHFISSSIRKQVVDKVEGTWTPRPLNTPPSLPCGRLYFRPIWSGRSLIQRMCIVQCTMCIQLQLH